jgi:hypothetical protein
VNVLKAIVPVILIAVSAFSAQKARAQSLAATLERIANSKVDTVKERALLALITIGRRDKVGICSPNASVEVRRALIAALARENDVVHGRVAYRSATSPRGGSRLSESEMEYYANLIGCVAGLRDHAALPGLLGAIGTGWGAINGVVALGEDAVPELIRFLDTPGSLNRSSVVRALGKLVSRRPFPLSTEPLPPLSEGASGVIRTRLLLALRDDDIYAREAAISALTPFPDLEVRRAIEAVAERDPATSIHPVSGAKYYPVRSAARAWLQRDSLRLPEKAR